MGIALGADVAPDIQAFLEHWRAATKGERVPALSDYLDLPPFAYQRDTAIVDIADGGQMRYRLFGGGLSDLSGEDLTGQDVLSHFHPAARAEAERLVWAAIGIPCGYLLRRQMRRGLLEFTAIGIGLPLRNVQSGRSCVVGFTSNTAKHTAVADSEEKAFVTGVQLVRWIDLGAGTP